MGYGFGWGQGTALHGDPDPPGEGLFWEGASPVPLYSIGYIQCPVHTLNLLPYVTATMWPCAVNTADYFCSTQMCNNTITVVS